VYGSGWVVSTSASDWLERLVSEMTLIGMLNSTHSFLTAQFQIFGCRQHDLQLPTTFKRIFRFGKFTRRNENWNLCTQLSCIFALFIFSSELCIFCTWGFVVILNFHLECWSISDKICINRWPWGHICLAVQYLFLLLSNDS